MDDITEFARECAREFTRKSGRTVIVVCAKAFTTGTLLVTKDDFMFSWQRPCSLDYSVVWVKGKLSRAYEADSTFHHTLEEAMAEYMGQLGDRNGN